MKKLFSIIVLLLTGIHAYTQNNFDPESILKQKPSPPRLVNDYTGTLTPDQKQALENKLVKFDDSTSTQIAVVIIPTLNGRFFQQTFRIRVRLMLGKTQNRNQQ